MQASRFVKQLDPTINFHSKSKLVLEEGAQTVNYTTATASSIASNSIQFNSINPTNIETIVDRKIFIRAAFRLTLTGDATTVPIGEYLLQTNGRGIDGQAVAPELGGLASTSADALRAFPLSQMVENLSVKINGETFNQTLSDYIEPLMRYANDRDVAEQDWSMTPTMQDTYQQYDDFTVYGGGANPLAGYGNSQYRTCRGGFAGLNVTSQTASTGAGTVTSVVDFEVCEPLFISPLVQGKGAKRGLVGISTMNIRLNLAADYAKKVWSHDAVSSGKTINSITLDYNVSTPGFAAIPEIMLRYLTPRDALELPTDAIYGYNDINDYNTQIQAIVAPGSTQNFVINNVQLGSVPKRVYLFARENSGDKSFNSTDTYARIRSLKMAFGNNNGLLSSANEQQLYLMSVANGLKSSWDEWSRHTGSVFCIDFASQVTTDHKTIVGQLGQYSIRFEGQIQNLSNAPKQYDIHMVTVLDGYVEVDGQRIESSDNLGLIDMVYDSELVEEIPWDQFELYYGSGVASKLKMVLKKAAPVIGKKLGKMIKEYGPGALKLALAEIPGVGPELAAVVGKVIDDVQEGVHPAQVAIDAVEDALSRLKTSDSFKKEVGAGVLGGGVLGGKKLSKKSLIDRY